MAQLILHPRSPDDQPIEDATITATLLGQDGARIWVAGDGASYAGTTTAVQNPPGTYTLTLHPNTDLRRGTYYQLALIIGADTLYQIVTIPSEGTFTLREVATMANGTGTGSGTTSGGVPFLLSEKEKLAGIEIGAERNVQVDWASTDPSSETFIKNKPLINSQGAVVSIIHDSTLTGHSSQQNPLRVTNPFTEADEQKLDGIEPRAQRNVQSNWNENDDTSPSYIQNRPFTTEQGLRTDSSLFGDGINTELGVDVPFTRSEYQKLRDLPANAEANVQSNWATTDPNDDSFIRNKPTITPGGTITSIPHDNTLTLDGSPPTLKVTTPFTQAEKTKLLSVETGAQANVQTDWNATSGAAVLLNKPDIVGIVHAQLTVVDVVAMKSVNLVQDPIRPATVRANNIALPFVVDGTTYTLNSVAYDSASNSITAFFIPANSRDVLRTIQIEFNGHRYALGESAYFVGNPLGDAYVWNPVAASLGSVGSAVEIKIYERLDADNYVPGTGTDGDFLYRRNNKPEWKAPRDTDIAGFPSAPDKAAASAGQALVLNSAKTAYELATVSGGGAAPTTGQVYTRAKDIIVGGGGINIADDDAAETITVRLGAEARGNTFPTSPMVGDRFDLLSNQNVDVGAVLTVGRNQDQYGYYASGVRPVGSIDKPTAAVPGILWFDNTSLNQAALQDRIVFYTGRTGKIPRTVTIAGTDHPMSQVPGTSHVYRSTTEVRTNPFPTIGAKVKIQVTFTDNSLAWPVQTFTPHSYQWNGYYWIKWFNLEPEDIRNELQSLHGDDRLDISAIKGNVASRFEQLLIDDAGVGLTVTSGAASKVNPLTGLSPSFDLDNVSHGVFTSEVQLTITARSSGNIGFTDDNLATYRWTDSTFASGLKALATYNASDPIPSVVQVGNGVDVYKGTSKLGSVNLYYAHDAGNLLGYLLSYAPDGGAAGDTFTTALHLALNWSPSDASPQARSLFRGTWAAGIYNVGEYVLHSGVFYMCRTARTASNTDAPGVDTEWRAMTAS